MDEHKLPFLINEYNSQLEDINDLLDCIAIFYSRILGNCLFKMKLEIFNIKENELKEKYKEYQLKMYEDIIAQGYELYGMEEAKSFLNEKLELTETTVNEFYSMIEGNNTSFDRFSDWFQPLTSSNYAFNLREEVIFWFNRLLLNDGYKFQVSKTQQESSSIEVPKIYVIENEPPYLSRPVFLTEFSYHLFVCFEDKTYMFDFAYNSN